MRSECEEGDISLLKISSIEARGEEGVAVGKPPRLYSFATLLRRRGLEERWEYQQEGMPLLRRVLTWFDVLSCSTCMTFGAGIYVIAGLEAQSHAGPAVFISFILAGITALISSFCYSEFASRLPVSGSTFSFVYISLGEFTGWMAGWIEIIKYSVGAAIAKEIAVLCFRIIGLLQSHSADARLDLNLANHVISSLLIGVLALLVLIGGVKGSAIFCRVMGVLNVATILFTICSSIFFIETKNWSNFWPMGFEGIVAGAARVLFAYIGFENSTSLAIEVKNPKKSMPLGVIGSLCLAFVLYLCSSLAITGMVNYKDLKSKTPFVDAFSDKNEFWIAAIVAIGSLLCMTTTILSSLLGLPRILYQMAKDGLLSDHFALLNRFRVPYVGTTSIAVLSILLTAVLDFSPLNDMICCGVLINYTLIDLGVIALRYNDAGCNTTPKHYLLLFATFLSCILFGIAVNCPHAYVKVLSILPFVACMIVMFKTMPLSHLAHPPNVDSFLCPLVPFLPCTGVLVNIAMIVQLAEPILPLLQVVVWLVLGSGVYFAYGIRYSKLNFINSDDRFYY